MKTTETSLLNRLASDGPIRMADADAVAAGSLKIAGLIKPCFLPIEKLGQSGYAWKITDAGRGALWPTTVETKI